MHTANQSLRMTSGGEVTTMDERLRRFLFFTCSCRRPSLLLDLEVAWQKYILLLAALPYILNLSGPNEDALLQRYGWHLLLYPAITSGKNTET